MRCASPSMDWAHARQQDLYGVDEPPTDPALVHESGGDKKPDGSDPRPLLCPAQIEPLPPGARA